MPLPSYTPAAEAGPSRRPLAHSSPTSRTNSLSHRQREKMPMPMNVNTDQPFTPTNNGTLTPSRRHLDFPTHPHTSGPRYDYHMVPSSPSSIRRSVSDEGGQRSRSYTEPYIRPPSINPDQAALLHHVREKMSVQDQEAMRRLRLTMATQVSKPAVDPLSPTGDRFPARPTVGIEDMVDKGGGEGSTSEEDEHRRERDMNRTPRPLDIRDTVRSPLAGVFRYADVQIMPREGSPFNIAVIGHSGVGKTTVLKRATKAWGVSEPIVTVLSSGQRMFIYNSHIQPGGKLKEARRVDYVELDTAVLNALPTSDSLWAAEVPPISGVILCYDATRASSLVGVSEALRTLFPRSASIPRLTTEGALSAEGIPTIILACKSDPEAQREVDAAYANSLGEAFNVGLIEVTALSPEGKSKMRNGLRWLLFKLEQRDRKQSRHPSPSHINLHHLSTSEIQPIKPEPPDMDPDLQSPAESEGHSSGGERIMWGHHTRGNGEADETDQRSSSGSLQWIMTAPVEVEGAVAQPNAGSAEEVETVDERAEGVSVSEPEPVLWLHMEDLYRKVFSCIVTKENDSVVSAFFLTYRRFATPLEVIREFRVRFQDVSEAELAKDLKMLVLQRLIGALIEWACEYPGDIVHEKVQAVYREILAATLRHRYLSHLASELVTIESQLLDVDDIDTSWSCGSSVTPDTSSPTGKAVDGDLNVIDLTPTSAPKRPPSYTSSTNVASASALSLTGSNLSQEARPPSFDINHRNGSNPRLHPSVPSPNGPGHDYGFGRWSSAWNIFIRYDPRTFAVDLTKLQWQRFAMIRPRDVFRHDFGKEKDGPVGYSIEFFNHVSRWVSTMILANPKPKHRARTYERFTLVVHHLRRLNNYDSLYAVISGMRETSIHRLAQTHALVNPSAPASREFGEHARLMEPRRGYAEYCKAFEGDMSRGSSAIPLLMVILGQISKLQSVRPEDKRPDGSVQWDKFLLFGQILSVISTCQQRGPMIPGDPSPAFQGLMENTHVIASEDALFERSRLLEPPNGIIPQSQGGGGVLKKLAKINMGFEGRVEAVGI